MANQNQRPPSAGTTCEVCALERGPGGGQCRAYIPDYYDYEIAACYRLGYERLRVILEAIWEGGGHERMPEDAYRAMRLLVTGSAT